MAAYLDDEVDQVEVFYNGYALGHLPGGPA